MYINKPRTTDESSDGNEECKEWSPPLDGLVIFINK